MTTSDKDPGFLTSRLTSRRSFLTAAGLGGLTLAASPWLAACSTAKKTTSKTIGSATASAASSTDLKKILEYVGDYNPKYSGAGATFKLGATLPFSGNGSFFGKLWESGIDLAVAHIKEIGGPTIDIVSADNGSGDAQKSHDAVQQMVAANLPAIIGTEALGGVWAPLAQYKILCLDSGAGAPIGIQGIPYYYGARSAYYSDQWVGTLLYMKQAMADKKTIVTIDNVSTIFDPKPALKALIPQYGFEYQSSVTATAGATDYSSVIAALHQANPDVIWASISQFDIGYFMKQYLTSGLKAPVFTFQWTRAARAIAGAGYTNQYFSTEFIDVDKPSNPWQSLYIQEYKAKNGLTPEAYTADFYMCVFMWWQLYRDVLAMGGNVNSGPDFLAALEARPTFNTVFGGDASTPGVLTMDLKTHSPSALPQAVFQDTGSSLKELATYDVGGSNFKMG